VNGTWTPRFAPCAGIVAVVLALPLAACGSEPDVVDSGAGAGGGADADADVGATPLVGTEWLVVETSVGGSTTAVPAGLDAVVRFDGEGGWSAHGCNYLGGGVEIDGLRLSFDDDVTTTEIECTGPAGDVDSAVATVLEGDVDAVIDGEELTLTASGGDRLRLEVRDGIFPSRTMTALDEGTRGDGDYRFGYETGGEGPSASWEFREAPGMPWGFAGAGPPSDPHRPDPLGGGAGAPASFVFGLIGVDVARVVYEPPSGASGASGEATELDLYALGGDFPEWQAYGGFVEQPVAGSYVVAYDAAGAELGRSVDLRWP
jgi:heat shock protein HslJ